MRLAIRVNHLPAYRIRLIWRLAEQFAVTLLVGGDEPTVKELPDSVKVTRLHGVTIPRRLRASVEGSFDLRNLQIAPGTIWALFKSRPDCVITAEMGLGTLSALAHGRLTGVPVWIWWGGTIHSEAGVSGLRLAVRSVIFRRRRKWISYGASSSAYLRSMGAAPEDITQAQNCADDVIFRPGGAPSIKIHPRPVVLCVARMVGLKGIDLLLNAAARLQKQGEVFSLLIVGDGPQRKYLAGLSTRLGLQATTFMDFPPPEELPGIYASADFLVLPTLQDVWGLVVSEALACGLPVICSRYAGCACELLQPAAIFDPLDDDDFDKTLLMGINGAIPRPREGQPKKTDEVAALIAGSIKAEMAAQSPRLPFV